MRCPALHERVMVDLHLLVTLALANPEGSMRRGFALPEHEIGAKLLKAQVKQ